MLPQPIDQVLTPLPEVEQRIVATLESLSRRVKASELPGLPGAKRECEEVLLREPV
jgi:hypothetical protein